MSLGPTELLIVLFFLAFGPLLGICTAISASRLPEAAFERVGSTRTLWIVLPLVGAFACGIISLVASIVWFGSYRPRVAAAAQGAPPPSALPPPPPTTQPPANWYPDPHGRHELRYFDGARWTAHVSDQGTQSTDPI